MRRGVVGSVFVSFAMAIFYSGSVSATPDNVWQAPQDFNVTEYSAPQASPPCISFPAPVMQQDGKAEPKPVCAEHGANLSLGTFTDDEGTKRYAIKIGTDSVYRQIGNLTAKRNKLYLRADNNTIIVKTTGSGISPRLYALRLEDGVFVPEKSATGISVWEYNVDHTKRVPLLGIDINSATQYRMITDYTVSPDRTFVLAWLDYQVAVLVDTETFEERVIGRENGSQYGGFYNPRPAAVTDDGRYAFFAHSGAVYDTQGCGDAYESRFSEKQFVINDPCERTELANVINPLVHYPASKFYAAYRFIDDGNALQIDYPEERPTVRYQIETGAYQPRQLEYLALGDSYSSGEGDYSIFGNYDRYMPFTDEIGPPVENCHLSKTSYPYLLRDAYDISSNAMKSVACSGAKTTDIVAEKSPYRGQNDRLDEVLAEIDTYQEKALADFIPGRIPQIEFVKKYQPKVITVGIGGNDSDFAPTLSKCVSQPLDECDEAAGLNGQRERVGQLIMNNFSRLRNLYHQLHVAAPNSKIYAIGYPQFIADSAAPCLLNGAFVNKSERHFINEAVKQMNAVIESAAMTSGVVYIDIENSLDGGKLCEGVGHDYVTGVRNQFYLSPTSVDLRNFLYHPNAKGHQKIAEVIRGEIGENFYGADPDNANSSSPEYSEYFNSSEIYTSYVQANKAIINAVPLRGEPLTASFEPSTFGYETITVSMFSTPRELGEVMPQSDGSLDYTFTIPADVELGYHTLLFKGTSYSQEPLEIVETIFVRGSNLADMDDDGIEDTEDLCLFNAICDQPSTDAGLDGQVSRTLTPGLLQAEALKINSVSTAFLQESTDTQSALSSNWLGVEGSRDGTRVLGEEAELATLPVASLEQRSVANGMLWAWFAVPLLVTIVMIIILKVRLHEKSQ